MLRFIRTLHNRRPLLWTVVAFVVVSATLISLSVWWNYLLVQNDRIVRQMAKAATDPNATNYPLIIFMVLGILCSVVILTGLLYLFLRLIRSVQLNLAQSQFIASVTHELRSPVASLQLMLETIRDESTPPEKRLEFEAAMADDLKRLRVLVDQVLDTARLEHLHTTAPREPVSVDQVLSQCLDTIGARVKLTSSRLDVKPGAPSLKVSANPRLLSSAILNVLDNAIKYSNGPAQITVAARDTGRFVTIDIQDNGVGISKQELRHVFKRFYRATDPAMTGKPGTGLGLYFARIAIRSQGGNISVQSPGRGFGSTFRIEVPKANDHQT